MGHEAKLTTTTTTTTTTKTTTFDICQVWHVACGKWPVVFGVYLQLLFAFQGNLIFVNY